MCFSAFILGLFYDGIGNEIGVEMALGEANKLNYAAAVKAVEDEEEARLKAEHGGQINVHQEETAAAAATSPTEGEPQDSAQSPDEAKGMYGIDMWWKLVCHMDC